MFTVILRFSANKSAAPKHMDGHNAWIQQGFDDGVFLMTGSLQPGGGGTILAHNTSRADLDSRIMDDPFVAEGVVEAEVIEFTPNRTDERLGFLAH